MSRSNTLSLVNDLSYNQADTTVAEALYEDVISDLSNRGFFTEIRLIATTKDTSTYTLDSDVTRMTHAFYDDDQLSRTTIPELKAVNSAWRDETGRPASFTFDQESAKTFRLFPSPDTSSKDFIFLFGSPFGLDFPEYSVGALITERPTDAQSFLDLPIALAILSREYRRESDHTDFRVADLSQQLADLILNTI